MRLVVSWPQTWSSNSCRSGLGPDPATDPRLPERLARAIGQCSLTGTQLVRPPLPIRTLPASGTRAPQRDRPPEGSQYSTSRPTFSDLDVPNCELHLPTFEVFEPCVFGNRGSIPQVSQLGSRPFNTDETLWRCKDERPPSTARTRGQRHPWLEAYSCIDRRCVSTDRLQLRYSLGCRSVQVVMRLQSGPLGACFWPRPLRVAAAICAEALFTTTDCRELDA